MNLNDWIMQAERKYKHVQDYTIQKDICMINVWSFVTNLELEKFIE